MDESKRVKLLTDFDSMESVKARRGDLFELKCATNPEEVSLIGWGGKKKKKKTIIIL